MEERKIHVFKPLVDEAGFPPVIREVIRSMRSKSASEWRETTREWGDQQKGMVKLLRTKDQAERNNIARGVIGRPDIKAILEDEDHPDFDSTTHFAALSCLSDEQLDLAIASFSEDE